MVKPQQVVGRMGNNRGTGHGAAVRSYDRASNGSTGRSIFLSAKVKPLDGVFFRGGLCSEADGA